jgi:hypothetical protein
MLILHPLHNAPRVSEGMQSSAHCSFIGWCCTRRARLVAGTGSDAGPGRAQSFPGHSGPARAGPNRQRDPSRPVACRAGPGGPGREQVPARLLYGPAMGRARLGEYRGIDSSRGCRRAVGGRVAHRPCEGRRCAPRRRMGHALIRAQASPARGHGPDGTARARTVAQRAGRLGPPPPQSLSRGALAPSLLLTGRDSTWVLHPAGASRFAASPGLGTQRPDGGGGGRRGSRDSDIGPSAGIDPVPADPDGWHRT